MSQYTLKSAKKVQKKKIVKSLFTKTNVQKKVQFDKIINTQFAIMIRINIF